MGFLFFQYLATDTSGVVTATHTTPVKRYVDDLTFSFNGTDDGTSCTVDVSLQRSLTYSSTLLFVVLSFVVLAKLESAGWKHQRINTNLVRPYQAYITSSGVNFTSLLTQSPNARVCIIWRLSVSPMKLCPTLSYTQLEFTLNFLQYSLHCAPVRSAIERYWNLPLVLFGSKFLKNFTPANTERQWHLWLE